MCIAVPVRVIAVDGDWATVAVAGGTRVVSKKLVPELQPGQYGLFHAGLLIQIVDTEEAEKTLQLFEEIYGHAGSF